MIDAVTAEALKIRRSNNSMSFIAHQDLEKDTPVRKVAGYSCHVEPTDIESNDCIGKATTPALAGQSTLVLPLEYFK